MGRRKLFLQLLKEDEEKQARMREIHAQITANSKSTQTDETKDKPVVVVKPNWHLANESAGTR